MAQFTQQEIEAIVPFCPGAEELQIESIEEFDDSVMLDGLSADIRNRVNPSGTCYMVRAWFKGRYYSAVGLGVADCVESILKSPAIGKTP
jgi:hypothetical protein